MASPMLIVKMLLAVAAMASGFQQNAGRKEKLAAIELGNSVPVSERGYQQVAAQKSDEEMKAFIHRVLAKEARYVKDVAELNGLVGFYSGAQSVQDLESLKKELRASPWVAEGEGRTAPLTEFGYQKVAKLKSNAHMMAFARRILSLYNKVCADEGALSGLVPYYSGEVAIQNYDQLTHELLSAQWAVVPGAIALSEKTGEDPEPVETTVATTTTAATTTVATTTLATTTLATTTLATTTLATTTLATTTLATTTLATTTVLTTLLTTTFPITTLPEEEVEEALLEDVVVISKHEVKVEEEIEEALSKLLEADGVTGEPKAKKTDHAKADEDGEAKKHAAISKKTSLKTDAATKEEKKHRSNATKESKTDAIATEDSKSKTTKENSEKPSGVEKSKNSWFGWLTR